MGVRHFLLCAVGVRRAEEVVESAPIGTGTEEVMTHLSVRQLAYEVKHTVQFLCGQVPSGVCLGGESRLVNWDA